MVRGLVILGLLSGAGWYAYRKAVRGGVGQVTAGGSAGDESQPSQSGDVMGRVTQSVNQAATTARQMATAAATKARAAIADGGGAAGRAEPETAQAETGATPREARAAAMAGMPAVQAPAILPEP